MEPEIENPHTARIRDLERFPKVFFVDRDYPNLIIEVPSTLQPVVDSFKANLHALHSAAHLPFLLSFYGAYMRALDRHVAAERIRALDPEDITQSLDNPDYEKSEVYVNKMRERNVQATRIARDSFEREYLGDEGRSRMAEQAINDLLPFLDHERVSVASKELMRQSIVLLWVSLEALATDLFVAALNRNPKLTVLILRNEQCKKRFQSRDMSRIIEEHGFDLSNRMGDVLKSLGNLDDPETIKEVFQVICPNNESLRTALAQPELWRLYQRRNLLVHRAAVVDKQFLEKTGEDFEVGSKLPVVSEDVNRYFVFVRELGKELATGVAGIMK